MKTKRYESNVERTVLTALIVHDGVLERIYRHLGSNHNHPFASKWSNLVASWCFQHFAKYQRAPRRAIEGIFRSYSESSPQDPEAIELVESFLSGLDGDYRALAKTLNEDYLVDQASTYLDKVKLTRLTEGLQSALERNDLEEAHTLQSQYEKIDFATTDWKGFDLPTIRDALRKRDEAEKLLHFPGDLDRFLSPHCKRGDFVAWVGPDKRGKSFWLQEVVFQALRQRRKVLYYVLGDMELDEVYLRLCTRLTRKPKEECEVRIPHQILPRGIEDTAVKLKVRETRAALLLNDVVQARKKLLSVTAASEIPLKIRCEGGSVVSAGSIEADVIRFAKQGWVPDIVVVDYADLLAPEPHTKHLDLRHQINASWMILRRVALKQHLFLTTASQTATTAYESVVIKKKDFSEDKRKLAHVTGMLGINQTPAEKERGIYRLNWVVLRGGRWSENQMCWTAGELALACPCFVSALKS